MKLSEYQCSAKLNTFKSNAITIIKHNLIKKYNAISNICYKFQIDKIIYDSKSWITTSFKENLIWNEPTELLNRYNFI